MQTPTTTQSNPYNTSTDTMITGTGNPLLKPQNIHNVRFGYTFLYDNFYLEPFVAYILQTDYILTMFTFANPKTWETIKYSMPD